MALVAVPTLPNARPRGWNRLLSGLKAKAARQAMLPLIVASCAAALASQAVPSYRRHTKLCRRTDVTLNRQVKPDCRREGP